MPAKTIESESRVLGKLFDTIRQLVLDGRYVVGEHAVERLDERRILEWQIMHGIEEARLIRERARDRPNPSIEVSQLLVDGTDVKVVWSHIVSIDFAKLVTVHFIEEE